MDWDDLEFGYLNRYLCDVFEDMRKCCEVSNYSSMMSLIEEAQIMGNRMEAKLEEGKKYSKLYDKVKEAKKHLRKLKKEIEELEAGKEKPRD